MDEELQTEDGGATVTSRGQQVGHEEDGDMEKRRRRTRATREKTSAANCAISQHADVHVLM